MTQPTQIIKLQRPLASSHKDPEWLVYDKDRLHLEYISEKGLPERIKTKMTGLNKAYFSAVWEKNYGWVFNDFVEDQDW